MRSTTDKQKTFEPQRMFNVRDTSVAIIKTQKLALQYLHNWAVTKWITIRLLLFHLHQCTHHYAIPN